MALTSAVNPCYQLHLLKRHRQPLPQRQQGLPDESHQREVDLLLNCNPCRLRRFFELTIEVKNRPALNQEVNHVDVVVSQGIDQRGKAIIVPDIRICALFQSPLNLSDITRANAFHQGTSHRVIIERDSFTSVQGPAELSTRCRLRWPQQASYCQRPDYIQSISRARQPPKRLYNIDFPRKRLLKLYRNCSVD